MVPTSDMSVRVGGMPLPQTGTVMTFRQRSCNQRVSCLLCGMARIPYLWDGSLAKRKVCGLIPCCGQDDYPSTATPHRCIQIQIKLPSTLTESKLE